MSEDTSPSSTSDEGSRSTPSNLPKAATRQRKKRTSDSEDEDDPSSVQAQEKKEKARKEKAAKMPTQEEASEYFLKNKQEQLG